MMESDPCMTTLFFLSGLMLWPKYSRLFAVAPHYSNFSRGSKHGPFSEATAVAPVNAQGKSCTGRCELTFILYQTETLPETYHYSSRKGLWCCASGQTWCRQEGGWEWAGGSLGRCNRHRIKMTVPCLLLDNTSHKIISLSLSSLL